MIVVSAVTAFSVVTVQNRESGQDDQKRTRMAERADRMESVRLGPRYTGNHQLGDGEEISILLLPSSDALFDQRCIVYKNANLGAVDIQCFDSYSWDAGDEIFSDREQASAITD